MRGDTESLAVVDQAKDVSISLNGTSFTAAYPGGEARIDSGLIGRFNISNLLGAWSLVGENVGVGPSVGAINNALIASPGHYRNISDPEFTAMGVGVVIDGSGRVFTAHVFGA